MPLRNSLSIHFSGFGIACCYSVLAWYSSYKTGVNLSQFYTCITLIAIFLIFLIFPLRLDLAKPSLVAIMGWAVVFRFIGFLGSPLFEDDFYRYLWDGYQFVTQGNPYLKSPEAFFNDPSISTEYQSILGNINYPEVPTVYGPGLQFLFGICYWIKPAELWPLKLILITCDLLLIYLLACRGTAKNSLLYAWNPLVIKEIAFTAHIDGLIPLLLIIAWLCNKQGKVYSMACILGFVATVKIPAIIFSPFLLWNVGWKATLCFVMTILACYYPFLGEGASDFYALFNFAQNWQFNSAFYGLLDSVLTSITSRYLLGITFMVWIAHVWIKYPVSTTTLPRGDLIFAGLIFVSPAINPWYWLWILPFGVIYPSRWIWVASFTLLLSYLTGLNLESESLQTYQQPSWVPWIEFGVIAMTICLEYGFLKLPKNLIRKFC